MTDDIEIAFLGINDAGERVYDWLCDREGVYVAALLTTRQQLDVVCKLEPDYLVSVGYRHVVPEEVLATPAEGCLNLHPAYLPFNRGANPNVWSIVEGTPAGVTLHYMDSSIDTGDIVRRERVPVSFDDTGKDLYERLERAQFDLFVDTWPDVEAGTLTETTQDPDTRTYHEVSDFEDLCSIDPDATYTAREFLDVLRALTFPPYNNAHIDVDGERYYVEVDIRKENDG